MNGSQGPVAVATSSEPQVGLPRVIVGVDGSVESSDALRWAVDEGRRRHQGVVAVLAFDWLSQVHAPGGPEGFDPHYDAKLASAELHEILQLALGEEAGQVEARAVLDLPGRALVEAATGDDVLVVGHGGQGRLAALLGDVASQVVHHGPCPVVVVRGEWTPAPHRHPRIVVGVDGSAGALHALKWAAFEARVRDAQLALVSADGSPAVLEAARAAVGPELLGVDVVEVTERRDAADLLLEVARDADLLVVGRRGRGWATSALLGSVSLELAHGSPCPVVIVPPPHQG